MIKVLKSNIILSPLFAVLCVGFLTGCMQEIAQKDYTSDEEGYEQKVVENYVTQKSNGTLPPVAINNPYLSASSLANIAPASGYAPQNIPVINNNASYSDLNAGIIRPGVFMQNNAPVYQQPNSFGSNIYSPTSR